MSVLEILSSAPQISIESSSKTGTVLSSKQSVKEFRAQWERQHGISVQITINLTTEVCARWEKAECKENYRRKTT